MVVIDRNLAVLACIALDCLVIYKFIIYPALVSPLSKIPNAHPSSAISPIWILWRRYTDRANQTIHDAHMRHGPVVRLGPNEISVNCVKGGIQTVYAGGFEKHEWYPNLFENYGTPNMFSTAHSKPHSARKRMISNVYSKSYLQSSPTLGAISSTLLYNRFIPKLSAAASSSSPIDIYSLFSGITMDFVTAYQFGLASSANLTDDEQMRKAFLGWYTGRHAYNFWPQELPYLQKILAKLGVHVVPGVVAASNAEIERWAMSMYDAASAYLSSNSGEGQPSSKETENIPVVVSQLKNAMNGVSHKAPDAPEPKNSTKAQARQRFEIASEMLDHLAAGFDTSGITMTYLVHELSQRPALQAALRAELRTLEPPIAPSSSPNLPSPKALDALPLLHAIVQETLRLHAAIPGSQPRVTPAGGCTLGPNNEYVVPGNVRVSAQAWSLHRNEEVFPEPEKWKPERWLEDGKTEHERERRKEMERWFWAFGSGGRMCVGSNLAMYQMKHIIASIYTNFMTEIEDDKGIEQSDAYTAPPRGGKLVLRLRAAKD